MKFLISLLLGLSLTVHVLGSDDGEKFSMDSSDTNNDASYNGLVIQVYQEDGAPTISLASSHNNYEDTYCLYFIGMFESEDYDISVNTDSDYSTVDGSEVDFSDDVTFTFEQISDEQFTVSGSIGGNYSEITLALDFVVDTTSDYGVEYTIRLSGYTWVSASDTAKLVMEVSVEDCSSDHAYSGDSGDDSDEDTSTTTTSFMPTSTTSTTTTTTTTTTTSIRRRMKDDNDTSTDSDDGISSDDSDEYDNGAAQFVTDSPAYDDCGGDMTEIGVTLVHQSSGHNTLHIVYDHFYCDLFQDPYYGLDDEKLAEDTDTAGDGNMNSAVSMQFKFIISMVIGIFVILF